MAGAESPAGVSVEILREERQIAPVRVVCIAVVVKWQARRPAKSGRNSFAKRRRSSCDASCRLGAELRRIDRLPLPLNDIPVERIFDVCVVVVELEQAADACFVLGENQFWRRGLAG